MRARHGYTLIECMIAVAILGIVSSLGWSIGSSLERGGTVGQQVSRTEQARAALVSRYESLLAGETQQPTHVPEGMTIDQAVIPLDTGVERVELTARWRHGTRERELRIVGLRGGGS